jgi:hypothetical protein
MTISVINGGGVVKSGGALFRVLFVLAIVAQGALVAHHVRDAAGHPPAITQQR